MIIRLQASEIILYLSLFATFILLCIFFIRLYTSNHKSYKKISDPKESSKKDKQDVNVIELFDYLGTKVVQENGKYTVTENGKVVIFPSWERLPVKYQNMVKELDDRSSNSITGSGSDYFMEVINGVYYVTYPDGKKKKYKKLEDVPLSVRNLVK